MVAELIPRKDVISESIVISLEIRSTTQLIHFMSSSMEVIDMKELLHDIPYHDNLKIDKEYNIHVFDQDNNEIEIIPRNIPRFYIDGRFEYVAVLKDLVFYGVELAYKYKDYKSISDVDIEVNHTIFRQIPDLLNGNYYISKFGAIYSMHRHNLRKREVDEDGYVRISFPYPNLTHMAVHRLVYKTWVGPIPDGHVIDHKDNRKWNNYYMNLQAVTPFDNSRMAAQDGLYNTTFHWTDDKVERICEMMMQNISVKDIAESFGITPDQKRLYKNFRNQLYSFRQHTRSWVDITSKYDFSGYDGFLRPDSKFRDSEIIMMRQMYEDGIPINKIAYMMDVDDNDYFRAIVTGRKRKCIKLEVNEFNDYRKGT